MESRTGKQNDRQFETKHKNRTILSFAKRAEDKLTKGKSSIKKLGRKLLEDLASILKYYANFVLLIFFS